VQPELFVDEVRTGLRSLHAHDRERTRGTTDNDLARWPTRATSPKAELLQGLLRSADVSSVVRRAPDFDVPEFLSAGPREVLVAASDVPVARDVRRESTPGEPEPPLHSGDDRPSRALAGLLVAVALVGLVVCFVTDEIA
jgi:hypothetical protein